MPALITHHIFGQDAVATLADGIVEGQEELLRHHIKRLVPTYVFPSETVSV